MTKLQVLSDYQNGATHYRAGQVIEISPAEAQYLRADSPGSFGPVHICRGCGQTFDTKRGLSLHQHYCEEFKALDGPPEDKMMRGVVNK